jgi:hypothetical protein
VAMLSFGLMGSVVSIDKVNTSQEARVATAPQCHAGQQRASSRSASFSFFLHLGVFFSPLCFALGMRTIMILLGSMRYVTACVPQCPRASTVTLVPVRGRTPAYKGDGMQCAHHHHVASARRNRMRA